MHKSGLMLPRPYIILLTIWNGLWKTPPGIEDDFVRFEARDGALRASGPAALCPVKGDRVQVQSIGVLPVHPMILADIGSVRADRGIIAAEFPDR